MLTPNKFATLPMCLLDSLLLAMQVSGDGEPPTHEGLLQQAIVFQSEYAGLTTFEQSRKIAIKWLGDVTVFLKEGHTSSVWKASQIAHLPGFVINIARDSSHAATDLVNSFGAMADKWQDSEGRIARLDRIAFAQNIPVAIVEYIPDALELTLDDNGGFGTVQAFNGLAEPDVQWLDPIESQDVMSKVMAIEDDLGISVTILHGDCVLRSNGMVTAVACDDPNGSHFVPFRHRDFL